MVQKLIANEYVNKDRTINGIGTYQKIEHLITVRAEQLAILAPWEAKY